MSFIGVELLESREVVDAFDGDAARVLDAFTAKESFEAFDPVRKANAANRGADTLGTLLAICYY